jgi:hypothetical protein
MGNYKFRMQKGGVLIVEIRQVLIGDALCVATRSYQNHEYEETG